MEIVAEMKKTIVIVIVSLFFWHAKAQAQIEINAYAGYVPASHTMYNYNGYRLRIQDAGNYGIGVGVATPIGAVAELSYMRFSSTITQDGGIIEVVKPQPISVEYYQLGVNKPFMDDDKVVPYGLLSLGLSRFNPKNDPNDYFRFAVNAGLGLKYYFTESVGIRLQVRMLMPLFFNGVGFGCGIGTGGGGCGGGASFGTEILQADFSGGVVLKINK